MEVLGDAVPPIRGRFYAVDGKSTFLRPQPH